MSADKYLMALREFEDAITERLDTIVQHIEQLEEKVDTLRNEVQQSHADASAPLMEAKKSELPVQGKRATFETMLQ